MLFISDIRDICDYFYSVHPFFNEENDKDHLVYEINEELFKCDEDKLLWLLYLVKRRIIKNHKDVYENEYLYKHSYLIYVVYIKLRA